MRESQGINKKKNDFPIVFSGVSQRPLTKFKENIDSSKNEIYSEEKQIFGLSWNALDKDWIEFEFTAKLAEKNEAWVAFALSNDIEMVKFYCIVFKFLNNFK